MGGEAVFTSHPNKELLKIHDPEKFGCTPCHGGNGVALSSVEKAHGYNKYLALADAPQGERRGRMPAVPLKEIVTEMADTLNHGPRNLPAARLHGLPSLRRLRSRCRRDLPASTSRSARSSSRRPSGCARPASPIQKGDKTRRQQRSAEALRARQRSESPLQRSRCQDRAARYALASSLIREMKKVGPSLKEVRMKMRKEWIPVWLKDPHKWRPGTKMPTFRLDQDEIHAIARVHLAIGRDRASCRSRSPGRSGEGQGSIRDPRLHGLPLDGRRQSEAGRHVRRQPEPRRREGQLRLPGALDPQSARSARALLPVREEGPDRGRLQDEGPAVRVRLRAHQVPQRRARAAGAADDADAEPAADRWTKRATSPAT